MVSRSKSIKPKPHADCAECTKDFAKYRLSQRFCSRNCRVKHFATKRQQLVNLGRITRENQP